LPRGHVTLQRSAWTPIIERGRFYPPGRVDRDAVTWATQEITAFIREKERRGQDLATQLEHDPRFQPLLDAEPNLLRRVMCADPLPIP
jgi:hypothetical protein